MINLRSDNEVGAHPLIIEAVSRAFSSGPAKSYGADEWTQRVERRLREIFDKPDLVAYPVAVGTAANVLALACCTPPWGSVYCHPVAHIAAEETNAFFVALSRARERVYFTKSAESGDTAAIQGLVDLLSKASVPFVKIDEPA